MKEQVVEKAYQLLPKYGGFVEGAVNQAFLLLNYHPDNFKEEYLSVVEEVNTKLLHDGYGIDTEEVS